MSCSCPTAETTGTGQRANARTTASSLNGRRSSKLPPPRVDDHDVDGRVGGDAAERGRDAARPPLAPCTRVSAITMWAAGNRAWIAGDHVAAGGRVGAGDDADGAREARQRPLALRREQALGRQHALEALDRGEMVAEPDPLDRASPGS